MKTEDIADPLFRNAVEYIDAGDLDSLKRIIGNNDYLIKEKLINNEDGYFKDPFLLYFIADNPIRNDKVPANIVEITRWLVNEARHLSPKNFQQQIDYTLALVVTGRIPKEFGVQIELTDLLIDEGAKPAEPAGALAHGNKEVASHLLKRGAPLNLVTAVGLQLPNEEISDLIKNADDSEKLVAVAMAAFQGDAKMIAFLIAEKLPVNGYPSNDFGFHAHATALHQAVYSGSLDTVRLLVEAGADLSPKDKIYDGTALDWAEYAMREESDSIKRKAYEDIVSYLSHA